MKSFKLNSIKCIAMRSIILASILILPLFSLTQTEDCNTKNIERLGYIIKNPVPRSQNYAVNLKDTTRESAASFLMNYSHCLDGLEMSYIEQLLGKGYLHESKDPLDWTYQLRYSLCEYDENGEEIMSYGIPSTLTIEFDENKKLLRFGIIAY